jgi:hypothetical protein
MQYVSAPKGNTMITLSQLTELLGWASVINIGILIFATIALSTMRKLALTIHSKMFGLPEDELSIIYFKYLANLKTLTTVFFLVPYLSLKIMGQ